MPRDDERPRSGRREALPPWAWAVIAVGVLMVGGGVAAVAVKIGRDRAADRAAEDRLKGELVELWSITARVDVIAAHDRAWSQAFIDEHNLTGPAQYEWHAGVKVPLHQEHNDSIERLKSEYGTAYRTLPELDINLAERLTRLRERLVFEAEQATRPRIAEAVHAARAAADRFPATDDVAREAAAVKVLRDHAERCYRQTLKAADDAHAAFRAAAAQN